MLDLKSGWLDLAIPEKIHDQGSVEIADSNALGETLLGQALHCGPCLLNSGVTWHDLLAIIGEARGISFGRVDVFQRNGEVDDIQVKVIDTPITKLFLADRFHAVSIVEGIPELGYDKELFALDNPFLDGASYTLARLDLVTII